MVVNTDKIPRSSGRINRTLRSTKLSVKVAAMVAGSALIAVCILVLLAVVQSAAYNELAQNEVDLLIHADLDHITDGVYSLVRTENEAVQSFVNHNLNVARHVLAAGGEVTLSSDNVEWTAVNQYTKESEAVTLPRLLVGETWLGQNSEISEYTPVVDEVTRLIGETATVFQKMNDAGDMLRVATTVKATNGNRAIGTYIPAANPDSTGNPVISTILNDETYHGRAYVVNAWYLTAYEPLKNAAGELIGMLYVGVKQDAVAARIRQTILQTKVGKTGYVYVIGGSGAERGHYIISRNGERDGEDIWMNEDSDGRKIIQEIVSAATVLKPGEKTTLRYRWQNPGEAEPRWKIARIAYYEPWDWVIGASAYEDELRVYRTVLRDGQIRMTRAMAIAGAIISAFVGIIGIFLTLKITRPVRQMTVLTERIISGDLNQIVDVKSGDEIGALAQTFNHMTRNLMQTMEHLKTSEEKYRLIFENALEGLFQSTPEGSFINVNPAMARILGYNSPEEMKTEITDIGRQVYVNPGDRKSLISIMNERGEVSGLEVQFRTKGRKKIWVSISARIVYDVSGESAFLEGFITNINDRKLAEEALEESRNYLNEIINAVADPVFVKNRQHRWVLVNDAMCTFHGHDRNTLQGKSDHDFIEKEEADKIWDMDELVLTTGRENIDEEFFADNQGTIRTTITKKTLYTDKQGDKFIVGIIRDTTAQKKAEEERKQLELRLVQAQKMEAIGTLAGGIAHDFNNILSVIIGFTELAMDDHLQPEDSRNELQEVLTASDRARDLVKQILTFSRMTETEYSPIALRSVVAEALKMLRSVIPSTIEIRQELDDSGLIMSDPTQINQIIMNLCTNAVHAMDETGGTLHVGLREAPIHETTVYGDFELPPGSYLKLSIRDTGKGIPPEYINRIYEPYFTTKEPGRGTGLGLSVIHGIVRSHEGAITCHTSQNEGTTFEIYFPVLNSKKNIDTSVDEEPVPGGAERILFIDDEHIIAEMAARILKKKGYQVEFRSNSVDALELFRSAPGRFDIVITDMTMPGMTGDKLTQELLTIRHDIPVILCTGYNENISEKRAKEIGVRAFLLKPLDMRILATTVRDVLDNSTSKGSSN